MNKIVKILMERDDMPQAEAEQLLMDARKELDDCTYSEDADRILQDWFGLEPDYIFDLIEG